MGKLQRSGLHGPEEKSGAGLGGQVCPESGAGLGGQVCPESGARLGGQVCPESGARLGERWAAQCTGGQLCGRAYVGVLSLL